MKTCMKRELGLVRVILNPKYKVVDVQRRDGEKLYTIGRANRNLKPKMKEKDGSGVE